MWQDVLTFIFGNPDGVHMALGPLGIMGIGVASGVGNYFAAREQRKAQEQQMGLNRERFNFAQNLLSPNRTAGLEGQSNITELFPIFQNAMAPTFNTLGQQAGFAATQAGQGMQANFGRLGLGGTGLGSALTGGLQAGAAFQTNALRARMTGDLFNEAIRAQMGRASLAAGFPIPQAPTANPLASAMQGFGGGLQAGDSI